MKKYFLLSSLLFAFTMQSQNSATVTETKRPDNWFNLDPYNDKVNGVSTERAYKELLKDRKSTTVIVGVLDSGVDFNHEDLKDVMWTNPGEIPNNGMDDDKNGYVDDIHGWNFLGNKDGTNVECENLECTRIVRKLKPKYEGKTIADCKTKEEKKEFAVYEAAKKTYQETKDKFEPAYNQAKFMYDLCARINAKIKNSMQMVTVNLAALDKWQPEMKQDKHSKDLLTMLMNNLNAKDMDELEKDLNENIVSLESYVKCGINQDFDPRNIIGDKYDDVNDRFYGNPDCDGPNSMHGTHVAGAIAATRNNGIGMDGVAANVKIMSVRCVPNGDEHDKDVANAIRYAVDNGAQILNMSFGKKYSPNKKWVDEAVKYAESKGVLIMHAAGNDHADIDVDTHYPCKQYENGKVAGNFMDVGALSWKSGEKIVASFSNYGKKTVDIFSPGVEIYSTTPRNSYKDLSGTSMATPVACGVAAVLKSYFPTLSPKQIKKILIKSSLKTYKGKKVIKPGTKNELVDFQKLSKNAGLVNLYEAVKMAEKFTRSKT